MQRSVDQPTKTVSAGITAIWPGRPYPLGATWDGEGVNFALFSEHAERVELCLFDAAGRREIQRIALREHTDQVWHCYLPEARPGLLYGYRVHGPYGPEEGHRFNPHKLLLDPYARSIVGHAALERRALRLPDRPAGARTCRSTAATARRGMPKCRVIDSGLHLGRRPAPGRAVAARR